jgi:acetyl esterase/lipase
MMGNRLERKIKTVTHSCMPVCLPAAVLCSCLALAAWPAKGQATTPAPCYDANDPDDLLLWTNQAPGAVGSDPCTDVPFLRVFRPSGPAPATDTGIIVIPGGGYDQLSDVSEQSPVGTFFANQLGVTAFVLYYRLVQQNGTYRYPTPMWDGQRAIRLVRYNAAQFGINPERLGVFGFSAGGHLASTIAIHFASNFDIPFSDTIDQTDARPDFLGLGYPVISMDLHQYAAPSSHSHLLYGYSGSELAQLENYLSGQKQVDSHTPPTFIFTSYDDTRRSAEQRSVLSGDAHGKDTRRSAYFRKRTAWRGSRNRGALRIYVARPVSGLVE